MIEGDVYSGRLSVKNSKLAAIGLPGKRYDAFCNENHTRKTDQFNFLPETITVTLCVQCVLTLHLHHINRNLLLSHAEDFKVGDNALKRQNYIQHLIFN